MPLAGASSRSLDDLTTEEGDEMSATLAPQASPVPAQARTALEVVPAPTADPAEAELRRRLIALGTPFVLGAVFFALSIGASAHWLLGVSLALGPFLFLLMTMYLCISSDTNGSPTPDAAETGK